MSTSSGNGYPLSVWHDRSSAPKEIICTIIDCLTRGQNTTIANSPIIVAQCSKWAIEHEKSQFSVFKNFIFLFCQDERGFKVDFIMKPSHRPFDV